MRGDQIIAHQLLMAQAFSALADKIANSSGYAMRGIPMVRLPLEPVAGMVACINDSSVNGWGQTVVAGGFFTVLAWYNGTSWKVLGA